MPILAISLTVAALCLAVFPMPELYYSLLRILVFGTFSYAAYTALVRKYSKLPWAYGIIALAFNPLVPFPFSRGFWIILDVAAVALLLGTAKRLRKVEE